ncbi:MAG TPA: N-acetylmuramoyl-L-alanine amidase [Gemmatimonadota bacterium]|nr:N-acetylmuramoyl-L-alanine amidase [Gemmatimonadota bacterium]
MERRRATTGGPARLGRGSAARQRDTEPAREPATARSAGPGWSHAPAAAAPLAAGLVAAVLLSACASARGGAGPSALPPIPPASGPLALRVEYPDSLARIAVRDSNFLFGSTGTGDAELTIDGSEVPVEPNGAFLAWLPVPPADRGDTAVFRLVARRGGTADTLRWPILLPPEPFEGTGPAWIDTASVRDLSERWALPDEVLVLTVRGAPGAGTRLRAGGRGFPMREASPGRYVARIPAGELYRAGRAGERREAADSTAVGAAAGVPGAADTTGPAASPGRGSELSPAASRAAPLDTVAFEVELAAAGDTTVVAGGYPLRILDPEAPPVAELFEAPDTVNGSSGVVVGRPVPAGPYLWRFPDRTVAAVDGRLGDRLRLRLGPDLEAWADTADARLLPAGTPPPDVRVGNVSVRPGTEGLVVRLRLGDRVPVRVRADGRRLRLVVYGARGATNRLAYGPADPMLEAARWDQLPGRRWTLELTLARPAWGWRVSWEGGDDAPGSGGPSPAASVGRALDTGGTLRLEVRRPPEIDPDHPLRGRVIAVDPGHPPAGAHGPTGLYEADANLAVARRLADLLRVAGARPVLVRDDTLPVGLYERARRAEAAGAELFVSIHANALPDGVRPFGRAGTSAYYYHGTSRTLARDLQAGMLRSMGLRDLGVSWADLAVCRQSWMPAALTEGAFMMIPRQEAALRTPEFQEAYARGVLEGLRAFLRSRAGGGPE